MVRISESEVQKSITAKINLEPTNKPRRKKPIPLKTQRTQNKYDFQLGPRQGNTRIIGPEGISVPMSDYIQDIMQHVGISTNNRPQKPIDPRSGIADGKVGASRQGRRGDCYFLASINSIRNTKDGEKIFKNNIKHNGDGSITVTLPGAVAVRNDYMRKGMTRCEVTGVYRISKEAIQKAVGHSGNSYSSGDLEVIALEIAMENYRAEMVATTKIYGRTTNDYTPEAATSHLDGNDYLSSGQSYDATFLLTGQKSDVYLCKQNKYNQVKPYQDGQFGYITEEEMNRPTSGLHNSLSLNTKGISEVSNITHNDSKLQQMLDKYQGHEKEYALTFNVRVAKNGPDGHTVAGSGHALTVVKITATTVYVSNPWHPDKIEPIPRVEFEKMATGFTATPMTNGKIQDNYTMNIANQHLNETKPHHVSTLNLTFANIFNQNRIEPGNSTNSNISTARLSQYLQYYNLKQSDSQQLDADSLIKGLNRATKKELSQEELDCIARMYSQMTTTEDFEISDADRKILTELTKNGSN